MRLTRTQRLIRIVQVLQAGRRYDINTLARELGVSRRTIFRDINVLKEAGVACQYNAETESYSIDNAYYLRPVNVTLEEGLALMLLTRKFLDERVVPSAASAVSAGLKIESVLPGKVREHCGALLEGVSVDWGKVSDVDSVADIIGQIQRAIAAKNKIQMRYDSYYEGHEIETVLRPYWMTFKTRAWYVIGYSEKHAEVRTFKMERIVDMTVLEQRYPPDPDFNIENYFGNAWDMIRGKERYHVEIHFSEKVAGNVEEVAWHTTQRTRMRSDGSLLFEVDVDGIDEIAWWILGYGDQAIVNEPEGLRQLVASHARNMVRYYNNTVSTPVARD